MFDNNTTDYLKKVVVMINEYQIFITRRTCMNTSMSFQVESVVETFPTKSAQVSFSLAMTFKMAVQQPLYGKFFTANFAHKASFSVFVCKDKKNIIYTSGSISEYH